MSSTIQNLPLSWFLPQKGLFSAQYLPEDEEDLRWRDHFGGLDILMVLLTFTLPHEFTFL
jgi:hypothetical protein